MRLICSQKGSKVRTLRPSGSNCLATVAVSDVEVLLRGLGIFLPAIEFAERIAVVDPQGSGFLDLDGFLRLISSALRSDDDVLAQYFKVIDVDGNGVLTKDDVRSAFERLIPDLSDAEVDNLLIAAGADAHGCITLPSFLAALRSLRLQQ